MNKEEEKTDVKKEVVMILLNEMKGLEDDNKQLRKETKHERYTEIKENVSAMCEIANTLCNVVHR